MDVADVQRLLALLLRQSGRSLTAPQVKSIAERVKGHPPSAYYAARLVKGYGPELVERRGTVLEDFQASTFVRYLTENAALSERHQRALRLLSIYTPLPLDIIQGAIAVSVEDATEIITELVDLSLVVPHDDGMYGLAGPVDAAVRRIFGAASVDHFVVASALQDYLERADDADRHLVLCQLAFRAAAYSDSTPPTWAVQLATDLLEVAQQSYHAREYERAVKYSRLVIEERPKDPEAHRFLVRGLIQLEQFADAKIGLDFFRKNGLLRDYHFLMGFWARRQEHPKAAIASYSRAKQVGYNGVALHRELALCHFLLGDVEEARQHIASARASDSDNRYLVDLELKIALASRDLRTAKRLVSRLEGVDRPAFVMFRKSMIAHAEGQLEEAVRYAASAVEDPIHGKPTFEVTAQFAKCLIDSSQFARAAEILVRMDRVFSKRRADVRNGLWCKWEIAQRHWDEADGRWSQLKDKSRPVHLGLRRTIVDGFLRRSGLPSAERDRLEKERRDIESTLTELGEEKLWFAEISDYVRND